MSLRRFARIALTVGGVLWPVMSPAWTVPGLVKGAPLSALGGLLAACALAVAGREER